MLNAGNSIRLLGDMTACMNENVKEYLSQNAMEMIIDTEETCFTRQNLWATRVGKSGKAMSSLASLPPTTEAFYANVKRVHIQACLWRHA
ncbi:hypothetical protein DPMN_011850 [Dreissena polymorpha]|uniref:Uncharacterized protein n=1 Tax=Dreissena polymorpha TaxID=45954 RepID=A0A9D4N4T3_DREPO|nr:hypothetical protein DPMN_011850 [Dreissena polymorpha]